MSRCRLSRRSEFEGGSANLEAVASAAGMLILSPAVVVTRISVFCWCSFALFFRTSQLFNHSPAQLLSVVSFQFFTLQRGRQAKY